jgi:hypothetical protein
LNDYRVSLAELDSYRDTDGGRPEDISELAQTLYESGEIDYGEYIRNIGLSAAIRIRRADAVNRHNLSVIRLKFLEFSSPEFYSNQLYNVLIQ